MPVPSPEARGSDDRRVMWRVEHTTMTTNKIAQHIARKGVTKHMTRDAAVVVWRDLKREGWEKDGIMLTKHDEEGTQRFFTFEAKGGHVVVSYVELEVAS